MNERGKGTQGGKKWDRILMKVYAVFLFAIYIVAGLCRAFQWSAMPFAVQIFGGSAFVLGMVWMYWAMLANTFLSQLCASRRNADITRSHRDLIVLCGIRCMPGFWSRTAQHHFAWLWLALIPFAVISVLLVIRTALEDETLREELPGYPDYAQRVRYRLVPGIW